MTIGTRLDAAGDVPVALFGQWEKGWKALRGARVSAERAVAKAIVPIMCN